MLILGSASPRRRALLADAGIDHVVDAADIDERVRAGEAPAAYAERLARAKAETVAARHPGQWALGADTVVTLDGEVFGKPLDAADARRMLAALSGRRHQVITAVAVSRDGVTHSTLDATDVEMRAVSEAEIASYVATGEPMDKAGAYAIQGGAAPFVCRISGRFDTVVGLPIPTVKRLLSAVAGSYSDR
jgi:septum formation protein